MKHIDSRKTANESHAMQPIPSKPAGFTIVELLIVIVIIGILAAIITVAFNGVQNRARVNATVSGANQAAKKVMAHAVQNSDQLPVDLATAGVLNDSTAYQYTRNTTVSPQLFCITATNGISSSHIATGGQPTPGPCPGHSGTSPTALASGPACPAGYIVVPGSSLFNTQAFCVMKYEARDVAGVATSQAAGTPWVNISQAAATTASLAACSGCELITEAERLTIAQNVLNVASNWSGGSVGSGYIFSGHSDALPNFTIAADSSDSNGYAGTSNSSGETAMTNGLQGNSQRRTLTLSNGAVIWDFSGNVWELTQVSFPGNQQPGLSSDSGYGPKEWNNPALALGAVPANISPSFGTPAASGWTSAQGIGLIFSNRNETDSSTRVLVRGGSFGSGVLAGIYYIGIHIVIVPEASIGFRVAR